MISEIGASREGGISLPINGNAAIFERLKTTLFCNFSVIIEFCDSGMLHSSGNTIRFFPFTSSIVPDMSSL